MHQHAEFRVDCVNRCGDMAFFRFFKMAAVRHLGFLTVEILTAHPVWRANMRHQAKLRADQSNRCRDMAVFQFLRWRRSPSWIFKIETFN